MHIFVILKMRGALFNHQSVLVIVKIMTFTKLAAIACDATTRIVYAHGREKGCCGGEALLRSRVNPKLGKLAAAVAACVVNRRRA